MVDIENPVLTNKYEMEFDLNLYRNDDTWRYWANGTFQFKFANPSDSIMPSNWIITYLPGTSDLNIFTPVGQDSLPHDSYLITPRIISGRFSITVIGPDSIQDCKIAG